MSYLRSGLIVGLFTLLSRIFGLVRELVIANFFGTNMYADALNTAFKFPNLFRRIFGEGALSSVFIPIYSEKLNTSKQEATQFASEIYSLLIISLSVICIIFIIFMPYIMYIVAPGFTTTGAKYEIAILLTRITMPYMIFISLAAMIGAIHHSHNKFGIFAIMPILLNITVIISCLINGDDKQKALYASYGILFGGVCQFIFMKISSRVLKIKFNFVSIKNLSKTTFRMLKNMLPAAMGSSVTQLNLFVSMSIASFVPGAISIISYADRIYQFPLSIIGICFGTILLPALSKEYSSKNYLKALDIQTKAIKLSLFLSIASAAGIMLLSKNIINVIYERGNFDTEDTIKTADTIFLFALGLPAFILNKVLTPVFYANKDAATPFRITFVTIIINIIANIILIWDFKHLGIAIGTIISAWINIFLTIIFLKKQNFKITNEPIKLYVLKLIISAALMCLAINQIEILLFKNFIHESNIYKFLYLIIMIIFGGLAYLLSSIILKIISIKELMNMLSKIY